MAARRATHRSRLNETPKVAALVLAATLAASGSAAAQDDEAAPATATPLTDALQHPITPAQRRAWLVDATLSPHSAGASVMVGTWQTATRSPREWQGSAGFTKRVLTSEADSAISKSIEVGLGAVWGEDPRPLRSRGRSVGSRIGFALKTVVLAPRPDGHLAPAWGRVAGAVGSNIAQNAWLPSRQRTFDATATRVGFSLIGRLATNLWAEFGPDLRRRFGGGRSDSEQ